MLDNMLRSMKTDFAEMIKTVRVEVDKLKSTLQKRNIVFEDRIECPGTTKDIQIRPPPILT